jgi:hypothetical protein
LNFGQGEERVEISIPVKLIEMYFDLTGNEFGILPTLFWSKSGNYTGKEKNNWELMIMSYLGIVANVGGKLKPFATTAASLYDGTPITSGHLVLTTQEASLFSRYHKTLLTMLEKEEVYTVRCIGKYSTLKSKLLRKIIEYNGNHYVEKARLGQIGTEESINKIEMIRI